VTVDNSFAYFSSDIRDYMIEGSANRYIGNPRSFCNQPTNVHFFALTIERLLVDSITMCNVAFTTTSEPFETIAESLASTAAKTQGSELEKSSPRGLTLFHELIHLTSTSNATPDIASKWSLGPFLHLNSV
jgi:hypothetical protein